MNKYVTLTKIFMILFAAALIQPLSAQTKISGFISLDYVKDRTDPFTGGTFRNGQAGVIFSGILTENVNWLSELRMEAESNFFLQQAWIQLGSSPHARPKIGLYLVPFGTYNQFNRPHQTALIDFPLPVQFLYPRDWRDLGLLLEGGFFGINYSVYAGNGIREAENLSRSQQFEDQNTNKGLGFRFNLPIDQSLNLYYSLYRAKYDTEDARSIFMQALSGDWTTEGFQIKGEYYWTRMDNPAEYDPGEAEGYYVQLVVNLGKLHPVGSYQRLIYTDPFHGTGFISPEEPGGGIAIDDSRWTVGLNYRLSGKALLKLEYQLDNDQALEEEGRVLLFQAALGF